LERDDLLMSAVELVEPLRDTEQTALATDVVAGSAGCVPHLLQMHQATGREFFLDMATHLGDEIIHRATRKPVGWSWGEPTVEIHAQHLCGMAHGAAGIGHALTELFHATREEKFRYGAELAFSYEDQFFDAAALNWPDFRNVALGKIMSERRSGEIGEILMADGIASLAYTTKFMNAWCHGAPGILLTRLRASEVFASFRHREMTELVLPHCASLVSAARVGMDNFSLCHGLAGNAETLLVASDKLNAPALRKGIGDLAAVAAERYELSGVAWPCGTIGGVADPSLLVGEAGIGYFFLRVHEASVPSLLLPEAPLNVLYSSREPEQDLDTMRREYIDVYFRSTRVALDALGHFSISTLGPPGDEITQAEQFFGDRIAAVENPTIRSQLQARFALDKSRLEFTRSIRDHTLAFLRKRLPPRQMPQHLEEASFTTVCHVRIVFSELEYGATENDISLGDEQGSRSGYYLLYDDQSITQLQHLGILAGLILFTLQGNELTLLELHGRIEAELGAEIASGIRANIRRQVELCCRAGLVEWAHRRCE
jgi:hypothetical protein